MTAFHPELRRVARFLPRSLGLPWALRILRLLPVPSWKPPVGLTLREQVLSTGSLPAAKVRIIAAVAGARPAPVILWIHGGGYIFGSAKQDDSFCARLVQRTGASIVSVDYRLAPEHPYPAALDDCFAAYAFIQQEARALSFDPSRVIIAGQSAGAGLAAALALLIHDRGLPAPRLQMLTYPMLDDRTAQRHVDGRFHRLWDQSSNRTAWAAYLGAHAGTDDVPALAAPARRVDLAGLPPAWIGVGTVDLFHDENVAYAKRLREAGVPAQLEIVEGAFHAFDTLAPRAAVSKHFFEAQVAAINASLLG